MWIDKGRFLKRREVLIALLVLVLGACYLLFFKFFKNIQHQKADLSKLPMFRECMEELAETIIPETDTPGAKSAGIVAAVFQQVMHCLGERDQAVFFRGLVELDEYCTRKFGRPFVACDGPERLQTLNHFESAATFGGKFVVKVRRRLFGKPFISLVKELCVISYCRSMLGATQALVYDPIPARYNACVAIKEKQRSWALT